MNGTNDSLIITEAGNDFSVSLSSLNLTGKWTENLGMLYPTTLSNYIGIGTATPQAKLHIFTADTFGLFTEGTNNFGIYNITKANGVGANVGELYLTGSDTVFQSLEPAKSKFYIGYPKTGSEISIETDTLSFFGAQGNNSYIRNNGSLYNKDTIYTEALFVLDNSFTPGDVLTHMGGGRAQWQPLPAAATNYWSPNGSNIYNNNAGNVGIGTSAPIAKLSIAGIDQYSAQTAIQNFANNTTEPRVSLLKSRGATIGTNVIVQQNDITGRIFGWGADGASYWPTGSIEFAVDGIPGVNDMPGRIAFYTTPDGSQISSERMRITQTGNVGIGTTSPGTSLEVYGAITYTPVGLATTASYALNVGDKSYIRTITPFGGTTITSISNGLKAGQFLIIENVGGYLLTINDGVANLNIAGNALLYTEDTITLIWTGSKWLELSRSDN